MRVIELDPAETFYSLRDRLLSGGRQRVVLVVPPRGAALRGPVDLVLLRRLADRERLEVGLVTGDRALARQARRLGLPAFPSLTLAEHYRPGWWRGRRRAEQLGFYPGPIPARPATVPTSTIRHPLLFLFILLLLMALPLAASIYALPQATITLRPAAQPVQAIVEVTADPALSSVDSAARAVPARLVVLRLPWEVTAPGTNAAARQSARALALQALNPAATGRLAARLNPGEWLVPGATQVTIEEERVTTAGGATRLTLAAGVEGLAVAAADVDALVAPELARALPPGYALEPSPPTTQLEAGSAPDRLLVTARSTGRAQIDAMALATQLAGRPLSEAAAMLNALPMAEPPHFAIGPGWWLSEFGRLPLCAERIQVELQP